CFDRGNGSPFCSPLSTDTWYQGSTHEFIWNYNHPFYVDVELINLFLYYQENYAFRAVRNWTDIDRAEGSLQVKIDSTWFPTDLSPDTVNRTWTLYGFYLPTELDPTTELVNPYSQYPRPFNFSVVRKCSFVS
ncbi:uncharacterized protein BYT42DRAFT_501686, partial [Radiomyces spectabilis]|uniref:uncharacterized protein n=1 Tax=Radiomyces spectabilis TaxID=64574 RepID=UPI002220EF2B